MFVAGKREMIERELKGKGEEGHWCVRVWLGGRQQAADDDDGRLLTPLTSF